MLVQWRRTTSGWSAQVAYIVDDAGHDDGSAGTSEGAGGEPVLVLAWVAADQLRPA